MGVWAHSGSGVGVFGRSETFNGVVGEGASYGVNGFSTSGIGAGGFSTSGIGVRAGTGTGGNGVFAYVGPNGLVPAPANNTGVIGLSDGGTTSVGVRGESPTGHGGVFKGNLAQLRLFPSIAPSHPSRGALGDLFLDKNKRLWFCKGGTTWKRHLVDHNTRDSCGALGPAAGACRSRAGRPSPDPAVTTTGTR